MRQGILGSGKARATSISLRICEERATQPEPKSPAALRVAPILICGFVVPQVTAPQGDVPSSRLAPDQSWRNMMWRISHSGHHRIFDKFGVHPLTLAILGDTSRKWRPTSYHYQSLGCGITFHFRICKTIDFKGKLDDPRYRHQQVLFIIAAHLGTQQHRRNPKKLSDYRLELTVQLGNEGYSPSEIPKLIRLIDWLMPLPDALKIQFRIQLQQRLPDTTMPHITLFEELALKEGLEKGLEKGLLEGRQEGLEKGILQNAREAILDVLDTRFGQVPDSVRERVNAIGSEPTLKNLLRQAARASSLEEFQAPL